MELKIQGHWLFLKDVPTVNMIYNLAQQNYIELIFEGLLDWDINLKVSRKNIKNLSQEATSEIISYYSEKGKEITDDAPKIHNLIRSVIMFKTRPFPNDEVFLKYGGRIRACFPCVDNEANLVILPSGASVSEMRYDDFVIIEGIIAAKSEYIMREHERLKSRR